MFGFIKHVFIIVLNFGKSLTTKCMSLSNEPCIIRLHRFKYMHG